MRLAVLCLSLLPGLALAESTPMHHGVVFFCPQEPAAAEKELQRLKADEETNLCVLVTRPGY